jgi:hypothetical protein
VARHFGQCNISVGEDKDATGLRNAAEGLQFCGATTNTADSKKRIVLAVLVL